MRQDIQKWRKNNSKHLIPLNVVREILFDDQTSFFKRIYNSSFCRGMPPPDILQRPVCAKLLKHAVANDGINPKEINFDDKHRLELNYIWKKGWLNNNINGEFYCFPSSIHRWWVSKTLYGLWSSRSRYMAYVLCSRREEAIISHDTPLELVVSAIRHFIPSCLSDPPRSNRGRRVFLKTITKRNFTVHFPMLLMEGCSHRQSISLNEEKMAGRSISSFPLRNGE